MCVLSQRSRRDSAIIPASNLTAMPKVQKQSFATSYDSPAKIISAVVIAVFVVIFIITKNALVGVFELCVITLAYLYSPQSSDRNRASSARQYPRTQDRKCRRFPEVYSAMGQRWTFRVLRLVQDSQARQMQMVYDESQQFRHCCNRRENGRPQPERCPGFSRLSSERSACTRDYQGADPQRERHHEGRSPRGRMDRGSRLDFGHMRCLLRLLCVDVFAGSTQIDADLELSHHPRPLLPDYRERRRYRCQRHKDRKHPD